MTESKPPMSDLKPCPFCGGSATDFAVNQHDWLSCKVCEAMMPPDEWNTRPIEDALQSQIDRLQTQLSGITQYGSIDAAEKIDRLTKERDEARKLAESYRDASQANGKRIIQYLLETRGSGTFTIVGDGKLPWENKTNEGL